MTLSPLRLGGTLRIEDSLQGASSRFYSELRRLRQLRDLARTAAPPLLFLLDEIFHGTNSHDRKTGAEAVLRALIDARSACAPPTTSRSPRPSTSSAPAPATSTSRTRSSATSSCSTTPCAPASSAGPTRSPSCARSACSTPLDRRHRGLPLAMAYRPPRDQLRDALARPPPRRGARAPGEGARPRRARGLFERKAGLPRPRGYRHRHKRGSPVSDHEGELRDYEPFSDETYQ